MGWIRYQWSVDKRGLGWKNCQRVNGYSVRHWVGGTPSKTGDRITTWSRNSIPRYIPQRIESRDSADTLSARDHSSSIHSRRKEEVTQMSIKRRTDKQKQYIHVTNLLFTLKKERSTATRMSPESITLGARSQTREDGVLYDPAYTRDPEQAESQRERK